MQNAAFLRMSLSYFVKMELVTRRQMLKLSGMAVTSAALATSAQQPAPADYMIDIAPYELDVAPHRSIKTIAYNRQVPGPLLRLKEGRSVTIDVNNRTSNSEVVHWHGLFLPSNVDGAE